MRSATPRPCYHVAIRLMTTAMFALVLLPVNTYSTRTQCIRSSLEFYDLFIFPFIVREKMKLLHWIMYSFIIIQLNICNEGRNIDLPFRFFKTTRQHFTAPSFTVNTEFPLIHTFAPQTIISLPLQSRTLRCQIPMKFLRFNQFTITFLILLLVMLRSFCLGTRYFPFISFRNRFNLSRI